MATYYVSASSGNDSDDGLSTANAWLTIDKAANTVAAGDTVWICPGVYRELVTMDTAGSSGSAITYSGDFDGTYFGVIGPVIISAWDDDTSTPARASCLDMNNKTYVIWNKVQFHGGTSFTVGNTSNASGTAYEGCEFNDCVFQGSAGYSINIELNAGTTPTGEGLICRRCAFLGRSILQWDSNGSANVNLKILFDRCLFMGGSGLNGKIVAAERVTNGGSFTPGGITWQHCDVVGGVYGIATSNIANTTNPVQINNCRILYCYVGCSDSSSTAGAVTARNNLFVGCTSSAYSATVRTLPDSERTDQPAMLGGLNDWLYYQTYGWSPFKPFESMSISGIFTNPAIDYGTLDVTSNDIYGNAAMGRPSAYSHIYHFDGSDAAVSDPNSQWASEASITDTSVASYGSCSVNGSTSSNYVMAEGTNAPGSGATIANVYCRMLHKWGASNASNAGELKVYTDALGELLATIAQSTTTTTATWTSWAALSTPTGGWTWAKVQALEFKAYKTGGATTFQIGMIQVYVATAEVASDAGMVEANTQPVQNSTDEYEGTYCMELSGAGYYQFWQPVSAAATNISVRAKYDNNYVGTKPQLIVTNIPGVGDQTDTVGGSAGSYEQLSVAFTPTRDGFVRVKLVSNDTSATGKCFFDDIQVS